MMIVSVKRQLLNSQFRKSAPVKSEVGNAQVKKLHLEAEIFFPVHREKSQFWISLLEKFDLERIDLPISHSRRKAPSKIQFERSLSTRSAFSIFANEKSAPIRIAVGNRCDYISRNFGDFGNNHGDTGNDSMLKISTAEVGLNLAPLKLQ